MRPDSGIPQREQGKAEPLIALRAHFRPKSKPHGHVEAILPHALLGAVVEGGVVPGRDTGGFLAADLVHNRVLRWYRLR